MSQCEHQREKSKCRDCQGGSICEHDRIRSTCSACSPELVYKMYQRRAGIRKLKFELTLEEFRRIVEQPCVFCGEKFKPRGIDRKDNRLGYLPDGQGQSQPCCGRCNNFKGARDQQTWLQGILEIAKHQESLKAKEAKKAAPPPKLEPEEKPVPSPQPNQPHIRDSNIPEAAARFLNGI